MSRKLLADENHRYQKYLILFIFSITYSNVPSSRKQCIFLLISVLALVYLNNVITYYYNIKSNLDGVFRLLVCNQRTMKQFDHHRTFVAGVHTCFWHLVGFLFCEYTIMIIVTVYQYLVSATKQRETCFLVSKDVVPFAEQRLRMWNRY